MPGSQPGPARWSAPLRPPTAPVRGGEGGRHNVGMARPAGPDPDRRAGHRHRQATERRAERQGRGTERLMPGQWAESERRRPWRAPSLLASVAGMRRAQHARPSIADGVSPGDDDPGGRAAGGRVAARHGHGVVVRDGGATAPRGAGRDVYSVRNGRERGVRHGTPAARGRRLPSRDRRTAWRLPRLPVGVGAAEPISGRVRCPSPPARARASRSPVVPPR